MRYTRNVFIAGVVLLSTFSISEYSRADGAAVDPMQSAVQENPFGSQPVLDD